MIPSPKMPRTINTAHYKHHQHRHTSPFQQAIADVKAGLSINPEHSSLLLRIQRGREAESGDRMHRTRRGNG